MILVYNVSIVNKQERVDWFGYKCTFKLDYGVRRTLATVQ